MLLPDTNEYIITQNPNAMKPRRHLAAILFTDMNDQTLVTDLSDSRIIASRKQYHETLIAFHKKFQGRIVSLFGHGSVSMFRCVLDAMRCAREMQMQFQTCQSLSVRMGLHLGEVLNEQDDISGMSVNIAARIQDIGVPGSILISDVVYAQIRNQPEFQVVSLGRFSMKNISQKVHTFALKEKSLVVPSRSEILKLVHAREIRSWLRAPMKSIPIVYRQFCEFGYSSILAFGVIVIVKLYPLLEGVVGVGV